MTSTHQQTPLPVSSWFVYMVECADMSLYTGITTNLTRRVNEHNTNSRGARYTRAKRPVSLVYWEFCSTRSEASKRENSIKKLKAPKKRILILSYHDYKQNNTEKG